MGTPTITMEMTGAGVRPMRMVGDNDLKLSVGRFNFSTSYAAGGEALSASDINLNEILFINFTPYAFTANATVARSEGMFCSYNYTTKKVQAMGCSAAVASAGSAANEIVAGVDLSSATVRFIAVGT